jgi:glycosyltransferase involved in cell wall biosynthesis
MIAFAYRPMGFREIGGIHVVATEVARRLRDSQFASTGLWTLHRTLKSLPHEGKCGVLPGTQPIERVRPGERLLLFGCDSAWAYLLAIHTRCFNPSVRIAWLPSFHDPDFVKHRWRARLAQVVLKMMQRIGINVYVQTIHEQKLLQGGRCLLSSHALPLAVLQRLKVEQAHSCPDARQRPFDLLFLGRPTEQKGWTRFLAVVHDTGLRSAAIVPTPPPSSDISRSPTLTVVVSPTTNEIPALLRQAKLVLIPSDYESLGLAQIEAVASGCVVPILGRWPLWDQFSLLHWDTCNRDELVTSCLRLSRQPSLLSRLSRMQRSYLLQHPMMDTPFLPDF